MDDSDDICGLCGEPGADKVACPYHWPGQAIPDSYYVHAECEEQECARAFEEFLAKYGERGVWEFLR